MLNYKNLTCIVCPVGCDIKITSENGKVISIEGNSCKRGEEYAISEFTDPKRTLTTTVKIEGGSLPVLPVKSDRPIPKNKLLECMQVINRVSVKAPVNIGDIVLNDILGMDINIIATKDI